MGSILNLPLCSYVWLTNSNQSQTIFPQISGMASQSWLRIAEPNGYVHGHRPVETDVDLQDADPGDVELGLEIDVGCRKQTLSWKVST